VAPNPPIYIRVDAYEDGAFNGNSSILRVNEHLITNDAYITNFEGRSPVHREFILFHELVHAEQVLTRSPLSWPERENEATEKTDVFISERNAIDKTNHQHRKTYGGDSFIVILGADKRVKTGVTALQAPTSEGFAKKFQDETTRKPIADAIAYESLRWEALFIAEFGRLSEGESPLTSRGASAAEALEMLAKIRQYLKNQPTSLEREQVQNIIAQHGAAVTKFFDALR
jgi:hypothetical protein